MKQTEFFGAAEWIGTGNDADMPLIRQSFKARKNEEAKVQILGFGVFILYINGTRVHKEEYLPLNTDFEERNYPKGESLRHRAYPECFDVSEYLAEGENVISVLLGNGWYNRPIWEEKAGYGRKKVLFRILFGDGREVLSSHESAGWVKGPVTDNHFNKGEAMDLRIDYAPAMLPGYSGELLPLIKEKDVESDYLTTDCPRDLPKQTLSVKLIHKEGSLSIYDFGINTVGYPMLKVRAKDSERVCIDFSEVLLPGGKDIDMDRSHSQKVEIIGCGEERIVRPLFGWFGARYARVDGDCEILDFTVVRSDVDLTSTFHSSQPVLNHLHAIYANTQLCNLHGGTPSDCPHIERRGYTGDGQLCAHAGMLMFSSRDLYRKWLHDIKDCQDSISGHVQYTAPYTLSGGGPGGWGSAIATVPYLYYKHFGDIEPAEEMFDGMVAYLGYLDEHSENLLVTSDQPGIWCLGDWCTPDAIIIPPPFVNNYFYVKTCEKILELIPLFGREELTAPTLERMEKRKAATRAAYMNPMDSNFVGCVQGANAFALDMGIGDERTKKNFIDYYEKLGYYDTGIFGTEVVTRLLFEYGRADLALRLMQAAEPHGFGKYMELGETTIWEYWDEKSRSRSHPMFGAVTAFLFDYVLGIKQRDGGVGYGDVVISPLVHSMEWADGSIETVHGKIGVSFKNKEGEIEIKTVIPASVKAALILDGEEISLPQGESVHIIKA